jgi:hypothetical protein
MTEDDVCCLCEAAVCAKHLRVDPSAVGSGKKRDDVGDIVGLTKPLKWRHAADLFDLLFSLAVQEELRPTGPGAMALTVILCPRSSLARTWTRPSTPALEAM